MRPSATSAWGLKLLVYIGLKVLVSASCRKLCENKFYFANTRFNLASDKSNALMFLNIVRED